MSKLLLFISVLFVGFTCAIAQQNKIKFERFSVEEGLSQSSAFSIVQDSIGYIWIATYDGLNRYDGYNLKIFRHDISDSLSLTDNYIQSLFVGKNGNLWVGTNSKGICVYDSDFETFTPITSNQIDSQNGLSGNSVFSIFRLDSTHIIAITNEGINLINETTKSCQLLSESEYFELDNAKTIMTYFDDSDENCLLKDSKGDVWVGTNNGLKSRIKGTTDWIIYKNEMFDANSLSANEITSIMEDNGGVLWIGTSLGGVCKWDRLNEGITLYRNNPVYNNSLSHNKVRSFFEDSKGNIWVGTVGGGLNLWDRTNDSFSHWNTQNNLDIKNNHIREVIEWNNHYLLATDGSGLQSFTYKNGNISFNDFNVKGLSNQSKIWDLFVDGENLWIATNDNGLFLYQSDTVIHFKDEIKTEKTTWVTKDFNGNIWVGTFGEGIFKYENENFNQYNSLNSELADDRIYSIVPDKNGIWLGTKGGVIFYNIEEDKFYTYTVSDGLPNGTVMGIIADKNNDGVWITTNRGISHFKPGSQPVNYDINNGLQNNEFLVHSFLKLSSGEMLFGGINGFNIIDDKKLSVNQYKPKVIFTNFNVASKDWVTQKSINSTKLIELEHYQNEFSFEFAALSYAGSKFNSYQYKMENFDKDWKNNGHRRFVQYTNMPPGEYIFKVKASNNDGIWNDEYNAIKIIIKPAFWQTIWFKLSIVALILILFFSAYKIRMRQLQKRNELLENEVIERTKEVVAQKKEIEDKNHQIEEAFNDIQDSIKYAQRIQYAILPPNQLFKEYLPNSFVIYIPKDIVAGDFYWLAKKEDKVLFAAADCTGHGVPGAMVSVVCNNGLNRAVREYGLLNPNKILDKTREIVINEFKKSEEDVKDGMDIALCSIDNYKLQYAGAHNPLWIIRNNEIIEIKADKQPIGKFDYGKPFTNHEFDLQKGDVIYLFSDGYADQFGGERGKKFKSKAFKKMLLSIQNLSMDKQKEFIETTFHKWKGNIEQLDDVCVIGVKI